MKLHIEMLIAKAKGPSIKDVSTKSQKLPLPLVREISTLAQPNSTLVHADIFQFF